MESALRNTGEGECLFHSTIWAKDFKDSLKLLKGKIIPKKIAKRVGYLVCNCRKQHTNLDDIFCALDLKDVNADLNEAWNKNYNGKKLSISDDDDSVDSRSIKTANGVTTDPESGVTTGEEFKSLEITGSAECNTEHGNRTPKDHGNPIIKAILSCNGISEEGACSGGLKRLLVILHLCLKNDVKPLEPLELQKEKAKDFRVLNRNVYYQKLKRSERPKKPNYKVVKNIIIEKPSISISAFVGKQGKNVKQITSDIDCKLKVNRTKKVMADIDITVHAKSEDDYGQVKRRIGQVYTSLKRAHKEWLLKQSLRASRTQAILDSKRDAKKPSSLNSSRWDLDEEMKASPRLKYEKKHSHQLSRSPPNQATPKPLDESRCLQCLAPYGKTTDNPSDCTYHPGYINYKDSKWTCCSKYFETESTSTDENMISIKVPKDTDEQHQCHRFNGCTIGVHNWRPTKHKKCSNRKPTSTKKI